jgi:hypothetical protein
MYSKVNRHPARRTKSFGSIWKKTVPAGWTRRSLHKASKVHGAARIRIQCPQSAYGGKRTEHNAKDECVDDACERVWVAHDELQLPPHVQQNLHR